MIKLTKKEKVEAYRHVLWVLKKEYPDYHFTRPDSVAPYVCNILIAWCRKKNKHFRGIFREIILENNFQEFLECKPKKSNEFWWPVNDIGILMRTVAIHWCIEQVSNQK